VISNAWLPLTALSGGSNMQIAVGDLVRTGQNIHPHYQVIAVNEDRAWIRDTQYGSDHVVPVDRCHQINASPWQLPRS
jgi:hypothetical protein